MTDAPRSRPSSRRAIAWVDGRVVPASEATVPLTDDGFLRGDAVFDAVLVRRGRTHALDDHLARLRTSAKAMGIRVPVLRQAILDLLVAWGEHDGSLKLVITRGGVLRGIVSSVSWPASISLETVDMPWRSALSGVKTLSYAANQWAHRQARDAHADDALIVDEGLLMELPTGAICLVLDGEIVTPDPSRVPILDSVTIRRLGAVVDVVRGTPTVTDLAAAEEVFVASATRPVLPVHAIGDREYPTPGAVTEELRRRFDEHIDATLDPLP